MDSLESWLEFRRVEATGNPKLSGWRCHWCGKPCSADVTELVDGKDVAVCDEPDKCPALKRGA